MKTNSFIFCILLTLCSLSLLAQTTQAEFDYLTNEYEDQVKRKEAMKEGYSIKDYGSWEKDYNGFSRDATFMGLYREGELSPCAVLLIFKKSNTNSARYICIPHIESSEEVWAAAEKEWKKTTKDWESGAGYSWGMFKFISYQFSNE